MAANLLAFTLLLALLPLLVSATTRCPEFLGLSPAYGLWPEIGFGENVIICIVDTGVWPESPSFLDLGLPPVPLTWRGECVAGDRFDASHCNRKLIGARAFFNGTEVRGVLNSTGTSGRYCSPRDDEGHGTHTASTAAGSDVPNANVFGFASGTARGISPRARLAMYKACWEYGCHPKDVSAAIEAAIHDGVHVLSISIGPGGEGEEGKKQRKKAYYEDFAKSTFAAVREGIFVAMAASNSGPNSSTVENTAPWIMTVGAGSIDRRFPARNTLGNGKVYVGESLYANRSNVPAGMMSPLIYLPNCSDILLVPETVKGKIIACPYRGELVHIGRTIQAAGGVGLIGLNFPEEGQGIYVDAFTLPALTLGNLKAIEVYEYVSSSSNARASLEFSFKTIIGESRSPTIPLFSGRGPNPVVPEILKPDIIAPGMNIMASWPNERSPTNDPQDTRRAGFRVLAGTSMACPHVAGIAALLRAAHPLWSPAMIRSAMMTTASMLDNNGGEIIIADDYATLATPLQIGAGHVDPVKATDPGLVYDAGIQDYIDLLCTLDYTEEQMKMIVGAPFNCSTKFENGPGELNYPSFVVQFDAKTNNRTLTRALTKVSELPETYVAKIVNPRSDKVEILVEPKKLEFVGAGEKLTYKVQFRSKVVFDPSTSSDKKDEFEYGYIVWENTEHQVKSPVVLVRKGN